jgi:ribosomal protein S18 acetylase RimI-like enzyme
MAAAWRRLADKSEILAFLETDRIYAGYAIGDLEPGLFERCDWFGVGEVAPGPGGLRALVLCYHDFSPPVLFVMGDPAAVAALVREAPLPGRVYVNCREEHLAAIEASYTLERMVPMWRMAVTADSFRPVAAACVALDAGDAEEVAGLLKEGGGEAFSPAQMTQGVYRGTRIEGRLVAVAGTHLVSPSYGIAAVGNVFTSPDWRGRGLATATTSEVAAALLDKGIPDVILNVSQANTAAIRVYQTLGFACRCAFCEGPAFVPGRACRDT